MNAKQKAYDSYEKTNKLLKVSNNYYHYLNLEKIKHRKPKFSPSERLIRHNKKPFTDYYLIQENKVVGSILKSIREKSPKPLINSLMNAKLMHDDLRKKYQDLAKQKRDEENALYKKRIASQKPFISVKSMDLDYENSKNKVIKKLEIEDIVLPPIWVNPKKNSKKRSVTESKIDISSDKQSSSNINNKSLDNQDNIKDDNVQEDENIEKH